MNDIPGPMPTPSTEEPELFPGGADAIADHRYGATPEPPIGADMPAGKNPAASDAPDEVAEPDDKQQEPDSGLGRRRRRGGAARLGRGYAGRRGDHRGHPTRGRSMGFLETHGQGQGSAERA